MLSGKTAKILGFLSMVIVADIVALGIFYSIQPDQQPIPSPTPTTDPSGDVLSPPPPSNSTLGVYSQAAVVSLGASCAGFGRDMLKAGGSAVDAAIATLLCDGVCVMQSMGVGGGFIMTIYDKAEQKSYSFISRETAPAAATWDMYTNHSDWSTFGPMAAAIPGELKGYQELHKRFGKLPWRDLFQPTIELCENGVPVNRRLAEHFADQAAHINASQTFKEVILNSTGGRLPKEGEFLKLPRLANTLRVIANSDKMADELYNGSLTKQFVGDIQAAGGIITEEDMNSYNVRWEDPYEATLSGDLTAHSAALPGSGILVTFMLRLLDGMLQFAVSEEQRSQLIIEAFKHAFGRRTDLGDPHFVNQTLLNQTLSSLSDQAAILSVRRKMKPNWTTDNVTYYGGHYLPEDHGTNNIVVVAPDGSAVCVTSSVNLLFGSKFVSTSTGILLNNQMDDFSTPGQVNYFGVTPSEANFVEPGKRPLSSMCPTIVVDRQGVVRLAVGAVGGTKITTQTTMVIIRNLWLGMNIKEAIDQPRFHHQLLPMNISYEYGVIKEMVDSWHDIGHTTKRLMLPDFLGIVTGIARLGDNLTANCDWRKPGAVAGF